MPTSTPRSPLMPVEVTYHVEDKPTPAINVKLYVAGNDFWPRPFFDLPESRVDGTVPIGNTTAEALLDTAYNITQQDFWQEAEARATSLGLGDIEQQGRSGGWLALTDPRLVGLLEDAPNGRRREAREFVEGYRALREWAEGFLADAPRRVASLAQQLAMDELGERAAKRMFASV